MKTTLSLQEIIRAWKDEEYRQRLTQAQLAQLPEHPAGSIELADAELDAAFGGHRLPPTGTVTCAGCQ